MAMGLVDPETFALEVLRSYTDDLHHPRPAQRRQALNRWTETAFYRGEFHDVIDNDDPDDTTCVLTLPSHVAWGGRGPRPRFVVSYLDPDLYLAPSEWAVHSWFRRQGHA